MTDPTPAAPETPVTPLAAATPETPVTPPTTPAEPANGEAWGADWRKTYAGDDSKVLARLERYQSPKAAIDALFEAQRKISAGEFAKPLPKDATPEQAAEWRAANGIPEKPEGYFEKLDGVVLGEEDKAILNDFATRMHGKNVSPDVMKEAVAWYNDFQTKALEDRAAQDKSSLDETHNALRDEWGADFRANVNMINAHLSSAPGNIKDRMLGARASDGTPLLNDPGVMKYLAGMAREMNPAATIVGAGPNSVGAVNDEIARIEGRMKTDRKAYMADDREQARYRELLVAREKMAARGG